MPISSTVFAQVMGALPRPEFRQCIRRYAGEYKVRSFSCSDQLLCMAFAQLTGRDSLRDIETCLRAMQPHVYHMGIRGRVSRSTLADANESRSWRIYADLAQMLMADARALYRNDDFGVALEAAVYAFDSTTIDMCLTVFPWARFQRTKSAVKVHTLLNLRGDIPEFVHISDTKMGDVQGMDLLPFAPGAFYLLDRAYVDFARLFAVHQAGAFFVTRAKRNTQFKRSSARPVDKAGGLRCDQTVHLTGVDSQHTYPHPIRRVVYVDAETSQRLVFLTNDFTLPALTITQLYKARWRIELFFKWIKQHLRIKTFYGTSENAVKTQIWTAVCTYLLVAILKKRLDLPQSLYSILQVLSVTIFEKRPIKDILFEAEKTNPDTTGHNQLQFNYL